MRRVSAIVVATVLLSGCRTDSEKLVDLRTDLRTKMDGLYSAYGGSGLAAQARAEAESERGDEGRAMAARVVGELDRSYFEAYCLARGRGERPFSLSGKLEDFLNDADNGKTCRDAARLAGRIAELERKAER